MKLGPLVADPTEIVGAANAAASAATTRAICLHSILDVDVYRLATPPPGPDWVVRVVDDTVGRAALDTAAAVLASLAPTRFPAERCVDGPAVLSFGAAGARRHLLVTEYVEASPSPKAGFTLAWCGGLLGRLAQRSGAALPPGGGWHRLGMTPGEEIDSALRLVGQVGRPVAELVDLLAEADDGVGLPEALVHPDLTPANAITRGPQPPVIIDWIGVGRGPRIWALAALLLAAGPRGAPAVWQRYRRSVTLTDEEWARLPGALITRPLTLDAWAVAYERLAPSRACLRARQQRRRARDVMAALRSEG